MYIYHSCHVVHFICVSNTPVHQTTDIAMQPTHSTVRYIIARLNSIGGLYSILHTFPCRCVFLCAITYAPLFRCARPRQCGSSPQKTATSTHRLHTMGYASARDVSAITDTVSLFYNKFYFNTDSSNGNVTKVTTTDKYVPLFSVRSSYHYRHRILHPHIRNRHQQPSRPPWPPHHSL